MSKAKEFAKYAAGLTALTVVGAGAVWQTHSYIAKKRFEQTMKAWNEGAFPMSIACKSGAADAGVTQETILPLPQHPEEREFFQRAVQDGDCRYIITPQQKPAP